MEHKPNEMRSGALTGFLIALLLAALPAAVWLDLTNLAEGALQAAGQRPQFGDHQRARLLRSQRRRAHPRPPGRHPGRPQLRDHPRRDPDPGDAVAGARQGDQRAAAEHHLSLRLRLPVQEPRAAPARRVREGRAAEPARRSRPEDRRAPRPRCSATTSAWSRPSSWAPPASAATTPTPRARSATGRSATCAASRRSIDHPADRREPLLVQISAGLFRAGGDRRRCRSSSLQRRQARHDPGHEPRAGIGQRFPRFAVDEDLALSSRRRSTRASSAARRTSPSTPSARS